MKLKAGHKIALFLTLFITAVVLCTLPFLMIKKDVIYVYTEDSLPSSAENGFIKELQRSGFKVMLNSTSLPKENTYGFWFKSPEYAQEIEKSPARLNFLYTDAYYPMEWKDKTEHPIVLTPYQQLYEHYMRSNIKSAVMVMGVNLADYYSVATAKKYNVLYYGDNNQNIPVAEMLQNREDTKFLGLNWEKRDKVIELDETKEVTPNRILSLSKIVIVYHQPDAASSKRIPEDILQAVASGALVFSSPNASVTEAFKDNIIIYENTNDLEEKLNYYLKNYDKIQDKIISAQKITIEKYSSQAMNNRFQTLLTWLKENHKIKSNN